MKLKTVKSARKRVIVSGRGKFLRRNLSAQHLAAGKSKRVRSAADKTVTISRTDAKKIKRMVPYR